jgi:hypothetical protein
LKPEFLNMSESTSAPALAPVRIFSNELEAMIARSALAAFGIESFLSSDDCGGQRPHWTMTNGIRLMVRPEDADTANDVLRSAVEPEPQD